MAIKGSYFFHGGAREGRAYGKGKAVSYGTWHWGHEQTLIGRD